MVRIRAPREGDEAAFLAAVRRSRRLHRPWVYPPRSPAAFRKYLARSRSATCQGFVVIAGDTRELAGVINMSEIVRGALKSAYLGYYGFEPHAGQGHMTRALELVVIRAFG